MNSTPPPSRPPSPLPSSRQARCHVIAWLDPDALQVRGVEVYSEGPHTLTRNHGPRAMIALTVCVGEGDTYEEARARAIQFYEDYEKKLAARFPIGSRSIDPLASSPSDDLAALRAAATDVAAAEEHLASAVGYVTRAAADVALQMAVARYLKMIDPPTLLPLLDSALSTARAAALEEAAKVCEKRAAWHRAEAAKHAAFHFDRAADVAEREAGAADACATTLRGMLGAKGEKP